MDKELQNPDFLKGLFEYVKAYEMAKIQNEFALSTSLDSFEFDPLFESWRQEFYNALQIRRDSIQLPCLNFNKTRRIRPFFIDVQVWLDQQVPFKNAWKKAMEQMEIRNKRYEGNPSSKKDEWNVRKMFGLPNEFVVIEGARMLALIIMASDKYHNFPGKGCFAEFSKALDSFKKNQDFDRIIEAHENMVAKISERIRPGLFLKVTATAKAQGLKVVEPAKTSTNQEANDQGPDNAIQEEKPTVCDKHSDSPNLGTGKTSSKSKNSQTDSTGVSAQTEKSKEKISQEESVDSPSKTWMQILQPKKIPFLFTLLNEAGFVSENSFEDFSNHFHGNITDSPIRWNGTVKQLVFFFHHARKAFPRQLCKHSPRIPSFSEVSPHFQILKLGQWKDFSISSWNKATPYINDLPEKLKKDPDFPVDPDFKEFRIIANKLLEKSTGKLSRGSKP